MQDSQSLLYRFSLRLPHRLLLLSLHLLYLQSLSPHGFRLSYRFGSLLPVNYLHSTHRLLHPSRGQAFRLLLSSSALQMQDSQSLLYRFSLRLPHRLLLLSLHLLYLQFLSPHDFRLSYRFGLLLPVFYLRSTHSLFPSSRGHYLPLPSWLQCSLTCQLP